MESLRRKLNNRAEMQLTAAAVRRAQALGRTTQAAHSTLPIGEVDVPLVDAAGTAVAVGEELPLVAEETGLAGDDAWDAWDQSDFAKQLAEQLDTDLSAAKVELEQALGDAQTALADAGLARTEAAQAVSDAAGAVLNATQAIEDALAAQELAKGASPKWATVAPTADDAAGKPVGSIWYVRNGAGQVTQLWELTAMGWFNRPFDESVVPQISIGSGTYGTMSGDRLSAESVTSGQIAALAVTAAKIAADAVTAVKIAASAVTAEKINAGAVTTAKLDALAVTAEKLAAGAVIADKIAANAITAGKLAATAIDGMTITGALVRTAASGQRVQLDALGLRTFSSAGTATATLAASSGGFSLSGGIDMRATPTTSVPDPPYARVGPDGLELQRSLTSGGTEASGRLAPSFLQLFGPPNRGATGNPGGFARLRAGGGVGDQGAGMVGLELISTVDSASKRGSVSMRSTSSESPNGALWVTADQGDVVVGPGYSNTQGKLRFIAPGGIAFPGDREYARLETAIPGATLGPGVIHGVNSLYVGLQARVKAGVLYITGRLERSGGIPANHVLFTLPTGFRSAVPDPSYVYSGGDNFAVMQPNGECILALAATSYATITKMAIPLD